MKKIVCYIGLKAEVKYIEKAIPAGRYTLPGFFVDIKI